MENFEWNYRIGVIYIASSVTLEWEWQNVLPSDISFHVVRIDLEDGIADEEFLTLMMESPQIENASRQLAKLDVDVIVFCCTIGSLIKGKGWDKELLEKIESNSGGIPATSTSTGLLEVLDYLNCYTVNVVTPYIDELNILERKFLLDNGFNVSNIIGFNCVTDYNIAKVSPDQFIEAVKMNDTEEAQCSFISCTNSNTLEAINRLEEDLKKPILSSNQVSLWSSLRKINYPINKIKNYGIIYTL